MVVAHLTGMGWMGTALARRLDAEGIDFTWHDIDSDVTAWRASNGIVSPDGDARSKYNAARWRDWHAEGTFGPDVEPASYVYAHKSPPHEGTYKPVALPCGLHLATDPAFIVNVPAAVERARADYADRRLDRRPAGSLEVVTHGFSERLARVTWGWTADAELVLPPDLAALPGLALYGRANRFEIVYATGRAGMPGLFRIGTTILNQKTPKRSPDVAHKAMMKRLTLLPAVYPGVHIASVDTPVEGWRPLPDDLSAPLTIHREPGRLVLPPLGHSGIRWCPEVIDSAVAAVKENREVAVRAR